MSSREVLQRLKVNSSQWYQTSNIRLAEAARDLNAEVGRERVMLVKMLFPPNYSFAAPKTHLWGFNRSPLEWHCFSCRLEEFSYLATTRCEKKELQAATKFTKSRHARPLKKRRNERLCASSVVTPRWAIRIKKAPRFTPTQLQMY